MIHRRECTLGAMLCLFGASTLFAQPLPEISPRSSQPAPLPTLAQVEKTASEFFGGLAQREEGDLLSRGDVAPLFDRFRHIGWDVVDRGEIEKRLLPDSDWLVRTLRTRKGTKFMRDMSSFPGGYDRLDRMQRQKYGKREIQGLIDSPGGAELIDYLTTTKQGRQTGGDLRGPNGGAFNKPTHRLYTREDVFKQIRASYAEEAARRMETSPTSAAPPNAEGEAS